MADLDFPGEDILDFPGEDVGTAIPPNFAPIPSPIPLERPRAPVPPVSRETFVGIGAMPGAIAGAEAGGAAGSVLGPGGTVLGAVGGGLVGGALGAAGGSYAYDATELAFRRRGGYPVESTPDYLTRTTKQALSEAGYDVVFGMVGEGVGKVISKIPQATGHVLGVMGKEQKEAADVARSLGIEVGTAHVSKRGFVRGAPQVVGIFPLVGKPYKVGQERVVGQIDEWGADILNTLSPPGTTHKAGIKLTEAAKAEYDKFVNLKAAAYKNFENLAANLSVKDVVPTQSIRDSVIDIAGKEELETIILKTGEEMKRFKNDNVGLFLHQLSDLPEHISVEQARGLQRELNEIVDTARRDGYDVSRISTLYDTLKEAIHNLDTSRLQPDEAGAVVGALDDANTFFHKAKKIFETSTAQKFARTEKNIFEPGISRPGTVEMDKIFQTVYDTRSPLALNDLRKLVGRDAFDTATRQYLEQAYTRSVVAPPKGSALAENLFDATAFEKKLGLNTPEGWASLQEMLKGTGVTVRDWAKFLQASKTASDIVIANPSKFLARRMVLAGGTMAAGAGAAFVGGAHVSLPAAAFFTYVLNRSSKFLMNPKALRLMQIPTMDSIPASVKRAAISRLFHMVGSEDEPVEGETP